VEELIYLSRSLCINSGDLRKVGQARPLYRFHSAKMAQQGSLAGWPDSWNFLQSSFSDIFLATDPMRADGETMGLIAQSFDEIKQGIARRQFERISAGHEESFPASVAVGSLGDGDERHISYSERAESLLRGRELTSSAINQHQVWPRLIVIIASESCAHGGTWTFFQQPFKPAL